MNNKIKDPHVFSKIIQKKNVDKVLESSINGEKEKIEEKIENNEKKVYWRGVRAGLATAFLVVSISLGLYLYDARLDKANQYMSNEIVSLLTESNIDYTITGEDIIILEQDEVKLDKFRDDLRNKTGLSFNAVNYALIENLDTKSFENIHGKSEDEYLSQFEDGKIGTFGLEGLKERIDDEYLEKFEELQEKAEEVLEKRGLGK